jgi:hypothetical protein
MGLGGLVGSLFDEGGSITDGLGFGGSGTESYLGLPSIGDVTKGFTGQLGAEASLEGARMQVESAREAREQLERLNAPFRS